MKLGSGVVRLACLAGLLIATQVTTAGAEALVMAHALHTATHVRHRAAQQHHRHAVRPPALSATAVDQARRTAPAPIPSRGERRPPHQRAALPSWTNGLRQHVGFKAGNRQAMVAHALGVPVSVIIAPLNERQNDGVDQPEGCLNSGRGPPRAGSLQNSPPELLARPGRTPSPAPTFPAFDDPSATEANGREAGLCRVARVVSSYRKLQTPHRGLQTPERPCGCSRACRSEGTAACLRLPSPGGIS